MLIRFFKYGNTYCSVEHAVTVDAKEVLYALKLKKSNNELIMHQQELFDSREALYTHLKNQRHVYLIINNNQVLLKKITNETNDTETIIKSAFPNIKFSDFYCEILHTKKHYFVAICRKKYIDSIIKEYQLKGIYIIGFSLQNLAIQPLLTYTNQSEIQTSNSSLTFKDNCLQDIIKQKENLEENLTINNLTISSNYVLGLGGILSYFYTAINNHSNYKNHTRELQKQYKNYRFYSVGLRIALGLIFSILLINFIFFSKAHSQMVALNSELLTNSNYKGTLIQLQDRVNKKLELTKSISSLNASKTAWYFNDIGKSVPSAMQLSLIDFQPLLNTIKNDKEIRVETQKITVKGVANDNDSFSNWITNLEIKEWVEKIVVISFGKGNETVSEFEFVIHMKK
ncbi:PilN domain-containing protein [Winogradskyella sp.]|uniref:PilN domain-containing protein n=1 Tax=Winogradskyella sp. TaxID=1883156 RepID=UPI003AB2191D